MAARRALLRRALPALAAIAALAALVAWPLARHAPAARPVLAEAAPSCTGCHPVHYENLGACTGCHRGDAIPNRRELAHEGLLTGAAAAWAMPGSPALEAGERLRDALGCRRCHLTGGRGNALAASLDLVAWKRTQPEMRRSIVEPATFMPDFGLSAGQADTLVAVLLRDAARGGAEARYLVRFREDVAGSSDAFSRLCGPCHRALTPAGPLGRGADGPNLSGLLTPFYPASDGRAWTAKRLADWVRNPRAERPATLMRPVEASAAELAQVDSLLGPVPAR